MEPAGEHHRPDDGGDAEIPHRDRSSCVPLSRHENEILDGIEHGLAGSDPGLFARMSRLDDPPPAPVWARIGGGLAFAVMLLVFVLALPAVAAWALVGLVAAAVFLPVLVSAARWPFRA